MKTLVLDIETKESFTEIGDKNPEKLHLSLIGAYFYPEDKYFSFKENELWHFWSLFEKAELLVGHNILGFDLPVLKKYYQKNFQGIEVFDIMKETEKNLGFRPKLDDLARGTLGKEKSGDGLKAIELYRSGKWQELINYCLDDVRLTKEIFDHIKEFGYVVYPGILGKEKIKIKSPLLARVK